MVGVLINLCVQGAKRSCFYALTGVTVLLSAVAVARSDSGEAARGIAVLSGILMHE